MDVTRVNPSDVADQPRSFVAGGRSTVAEMQARLAKPVRRFPQQLADVQGSSTRSVSR
jgi:hypothetical protein